MWYAGRERIERKKKGRAGEEEKKKKKRRCKDTIVTISDGWSDGQAVWQVHRGTDRQTECVLLSVHARGGDYLTVCKRTGGVFALVCLRICVSCV